MVPPFLKYYLSFTPFLLALFSPYNQIVVILFFILPFIPLLGGFGRQLLFHETLTASLGIVFLVYLLPEFQILSGMIMNIILFWLIISFLFIQTKERNIRKLEQESILINFKGKTKPEAWPFCPMDDLNIWYIMIQGISPNKPMPVRLLLYEDYSFKTTGVFYHTWYEAVVMLNNALLKKLTPGAQRAISGKYFAHILRRDFSNLKNEIFWWGVITSWLFALLSIFLPNEWLIFYVNPIFQMTQVTFNIIIGFILLNYRLRQQEYQADERAADFTNLNDIYSVYENISQLIEKKKQSKLMILKNLCSPLPSVEKRKKYLEKFGKKMSIFE